MKSKGHVTVFSDSLLPQNDPTTLFTSSGMQPIVPYLLGQEHPQGKRIADSQKCFRAVDIEEVGDNRHTTFFEMLGNWSFGDYFKRDQVTWLHAFLTNDLGLDKDRLYMTCFEGDQQFNLPKDTESYGIWKSLGVKEDHISFYPGSKNWWNRGKTGPATTMIDDPAGPDTEVFYEFADVKHDTSFGETCHVNCDCGRYIEIGNSVFMEYRKQDNQTFVPLDQKNVDFGGGLERIAMAVNDEADIFMAVDVLKNIILTLEKITVKSYSDNQQVFRIITDHIRASVFMIADEVRPSNKEAGYVLRRLIRRSVMKMYQLDIQDSSWLESIVAIIADSYNDSYPELTNNKDSIVEEYNRESNKFYNLIKQGLKVFNKLDTISGQDAFTLFTSHGFPLELILELAKERKIEVDVEAYTNLFEEHRALSKEHSQSKFGGHGLLLDNGEIKAADQAELEQCTKLHTATHLLQAALREVLGDEVHQDGSDITAKRLRFDFMFNRKLTDEEKQQVEDLVNIKIHDGLDVWHEEMNKDEAIKTGALYFHKIKYPDIVKVYSMGKRDGDIFSREFCGGPHTENTNKLGNFKIIKEEAISSGTRRIKAIIE